MYKFFRLLAILVAAAIGLQLIPWQSLPQANRFRSTAAVVAAPAQAPAQQADAAVPFSDQIVVAASAVGAHSATSADFDRDGRIDVLAASREDGQIVWHRSTGNLRFTPFPLAAAGGVYMAIPADLNRNGYSDVLAVAVGALAPSAASEADQTANGSGVLFWLRNNLGNRDLQFTRFDIDTGLAYPVAVHAADLDRDNDLDVLVTTRDGNQVLLYLNSGAAEVPTFTRVTIDATLSGAVSVTTGDLDQDGRLDIVAAGENSNQIVWYRQIAAQPLAFERRLVRNGPVPDPNNDYAKTVAVGDLDGDGDPDLAFGSEGENLVGWYENQGQGAAFALHVLYTAADHVKTVAIADIDRDGRPDILAASSDDNTVLLFTQAGDSPPTFVRRVVTDQAAGARGVHAADFDHDGDPDIVVASRVDNRIVLHVNNSIHRSALLEGERVVNTFSQTRSVSAADFDGDGQTDIASTSNNVVAWHRNLGGSPPVFETVVLDTGLAGGRWSAAGDVDGDGDNDIVAADRDTNRILLYVNQLRQNGTPTFVTRLVSDSASRVRDANLADIDGDGDLDIYSATDGDGSIAWYENRDRNGTTWTQQFVTRSLGYPRSSYAADLDGDGDMDLMAASANDNRVTIFRQTSPRTFSQEILYANANGAQFIHAADLDRDGDQDIIVSSERDHTVSWFANRLNTGLGFQRYVVSDTARGVHAALGADLDGDGDQDIVAAVEYNNQIVWYENMGEVVPSWQEHLISPFAEVAHGVFVADLDGDQDLDVLSASRQDGKVAWHENRGGQFRLTQSSPNLSAGTQRLLVETSVTHRGRPGNPPLQLASLTLRFENSDGTRLTTDQVSSLFSALQVYQDNGDGRFAAASDMSIRRETLFLLDNGDMFLDLPANFIAPGATTRYFVVAEPRPNPQCGTGSLTVSIVSNGRTAVDGVTRMPLLGEYMRSLTDSNDPSQNRKIPIVVNELMADNRTVLVDPDEPLEYPDWFELHNTSSQKIDLSGMYLTDDPTDLRKYRIPEGTLMEPHSYQIFIADAEPEQGSFHVPFSLSRDGETLVLYDIDARGNQVIDQVSFDPQLPDHAWARSDLNPHEWVRYATPTPGRYNLSFVPSSFVYLPSVADGSGCY